MNGLADVPGRRRSRRTSPGTCLIPLALVLAGLETRETRADDWPAWRGPGGQGVTAERELPLEWSATKHVRWKIALPAPGNSTPIVVGDRVLFTQATEGGKERALHAVKVSTGELLWRRAIRHEAEEPTHETNPYASASPVSDGERVIVSYGSAGVHAYDLEGVPLWKRDLGAFRHIWGNASSPVIHGELCLLNCGPGPRTFLAALDRRTGQTVWETPIEGGDEGSGGRASWTGSWSTPLVVREGERDSVLVGYPGALRAFDPANGKERWACEGLGKLVYTSPVVADDIAVAMSGFQGPLLATRLGGEGDVTASHRLWRHERAQQHVGTAVVHEGHLYVHNDTGAMECIELLSGKLVWRERIAARSWSSVVLSEDRLYTADEAGNCFVVRAAPKFEILARNTLGERIRASIAVAEGALFIRSYEHLWCIAR